MNKDLKITAIVLPLLKIIFRCFSSYALLFCLVSLILVAGIHPVSAQSETGLAFLEIGVGARASAMGGAYTAIASDATATYWNPAGLSGLPQAQVSFTHSEWIEGVSSEFFALAFPGLGGAVGLSVYSSNVGGIERREGASDEPLGTIEAHDLAAGISYSRALSAHFQVGITAKYLFEKIYVESASGLAFDFGFVLRPAWEGLSFGIVLQNVGSMGKLRVESIDLPGTIKAGAGYEFSIPALDGGLLLAADGVKITGRDVRFDLGAELTIRRLLAFRGGYQTGLDERGITGGIGVLYRGFHVDYGYAPFDANLGNTHRISVGIDL